MTPDLFPQSMGATFSPCREYRYLLWRTWDPDKPRAMFLMLNPSTADERTDDRTVAKCGRYARAWGYGGLYVCNLFAYRATDPRVMKAYPEPVGPDNNKAIYNAAVRSGVVVCAWGNHGAYLGRSRAVVSMLRPVEHKDARIELAALQINLATGEPAHPLYLKSSLVPFRWPAGD